MLRQITLQVGAENELQDAAKAHGIELSVVDCKPFNKTGISLLLALSGDRQGVRDTAADLRRIEGVKEVLEGAGQGSETTVLVVAKKMGVCRASSDSAIVCLDCPLNSETRPLSWRFIARNAGDFRRILARLEREGIETRVEDVAPVERRAALTARQTEIITTAVAQGYFEFPRRISLTRLSGLLGVKPSTLSEVLRSAERRILADSVGIPFQAEG